MGVNELRSGNVVLIRLHTSNSIIIPTYEVRVLGIAEDGGVDIGKSVYPDEGYIYITHCVGIPLTEEWLLKLNAKDIKYPDWIKSVHELQNWYYWNNNKKELTIKD